MSKKPAGQIEKSYRLRMIMLSMVSVAVFGGILFRLFTLQVLQHQDWLDKAQRQSSRTIELEPRRGNVFDRGGAILATSYLNDKIILDARALAAELDRQDQRIAEGRMRPSERLDVKKLFRELSGPTMVPVNKFESFMRRDRLRREILMHKAEESVTRQVRNIETMHDLPGGVIIYLKESKRSYPSNHLASHVLGFAVLGEHGDTDGKAGIEYSQQDWLKGKSSTVEVWVDSRRRMLAPRSEEIYNETFGNDLVLTIHEEIQMFAEQSLARQVRLMEAKAGTVVVMDVPTGEILALANYPDYDPNRFSAFSNDERNNRALTSPFEIGSVMKIFTTSILLDNGLLTPDTEVDCHNGNWTVNGLRLRDSHRMGVVPFNEAFAESSNVAMATMAGLMEPIIHYDGLERFGFGEKTGVELGGESGGQLNPPYKWSGVSQGSMAIGYEMLVSPIQVCAGLAALGNGGWRMRPHIVKEYRTPEGRVARKVNPEPVERVVGASTCATMIELLEAVVEHGTGEAAQIPGYRIGGKTGTAIKAESRLSGDKREYFTTFVGMLPLNDPRIVILVMLDEPQKAKYASQVSVPVFRDVAEAAIHILGIPPSDDVAYQIAQEEAAEKKAKSQPREIAARPRELGHDANDGNAGHPISLTPVLRMETYDPATVETVEMPDCEGMTMIEAWQRMDRAGLQATTLGTGVLVRQDPVAGTFIPKNHEVLLVFSRPTDRLKSSGAMRPVVPQ